ncbi:MAG: YbaB/EbfC family nucleoid-associated protein [Patescibacteria group bacterium]
MFNKLKAIKDLRSQAKKMQNAFDDIMAIGSAQGGKIQVTINGNQKIVAVSINNEILGDKEKLENGFKDAVNDAQKRIQKDMASTMKDMGGLDALKNMGM